MHEEMIQVRDGHCLHVKSFGSDSLPVIVFLHGFTGSAETWWPIIQSLKGRFKMVAVDLTGHGKSTKPTEPARYSMEEQTADLEMLFGKLGFNAFTLVGYSMGGRIALAYTLRYPERVTELILESASPGLRTEQERMERREADQKLSEKIMAEGILRFVNFWENIPLFKSQKRLSMEQRNSIRQERLAQEATGLANSLLGVGTGSQPSYWEELSTITMPVLLITGEIDMKFGNIAREMEKYLQMGDHQTVKGAGHAIHVEKPTLFATMVEKYINLIQQKSAPTQSDRMNAKEL